MATRPFDVRRLDHVVLRPVRAGASMVELIAVDGTLGPCGGAAAGTEGRNLDHLCLSIEPFDEAAIVTHLARHGVAPRGRATTNLGAEGDGLPLCFDDPDGNTVERKGPSA